MKMDKGQKQFRKAALKNLLARGGMVANNGDITAVFLPADGKPWNGHFSTSYAGSEKFKRKYGEMVALDRLNDGVCLPITQDDFFDFCIAFDLTIRENFSPNSEDEPTPKTPAFVSIPSDAWPFPCR